jgi:uncharacterized surface protein with fasciclin (FAS1) repeats
MLETLSPGSIGALAFAAPSATGPVAGAGAARADIVDTAVAAGPFKTLAKALDAPGLVQTRKGPCPFTVFAPTDQAFAKLPAGTLENLLEPESKAKLQRIPITRSAAGSRRPTSSSCIRRRPLAAITIATADGGVMVDNAHVVKADIEASNGVIHAIDAVILPKGE